MATKSQQEAFLKKTIPIWQKYGAQYGFHIISFGIAQGCWESGWGTSTAATTKNNILGIGPGKKFSSVDECIKAYFTSTVLGKSSDAKNAKTLDEYYKAFVASGYLGGTGQLNYYNNIKSIILSHNLSQYDGGGSGNGTSGGGAEQVVVSYPEIDKSETGTNWTTEYPNRKIAWIVIHYTCSGLNDTHLSICKYFQTSERKGSADYVIGRDGLVAQYNPDIKNRYTMNCAVYGDELDRCTNQHSIGIENCNADGEGPFKQAQIESLRQLVCAIMNEYGIPADHVVRHCDCTSTDCPQPYNNETQEHEAAWKELHAYITSGASGVVSSTGGMTISHEYSREDALVMEFGYWDTKTNKPQSDKTSYKASAINAGELLMDIAEVFGLNISGGGTSGGQTVLATEVKTKNGKTLNSGTWKPLPDGVPHKGIIANFTEYDINWDSGTTQRTLYDLWVKQGKPNFHTVATIDGYVLIAPGRYFSNSAGDLLEVNLEDGTKFIAIVGDTKAYDTTNEYGHVMEDGSIDVIEWEFAGPRGAASTHREQLKAGLKEWGILGKKVTGMTNYGTYFQ